MAIWERKQQEKGNEKHFFSGAFYASKKVCNKLTADEIFVIYKDIQASVKQNNGIANFQVYEDGTGRRLFFIDHLNKETIDSRNSKPENSYCTLLFDDEYLKSPV